MTGASFVKGLGYMDEVGLRLRIEAVRSEAMQAVAGERAARNIHEAVCAERYKAIETTLTDMAKDLASVVSSVGAHQVMVQTQAWTLNWKAWVVVGTAIIGLLSVIAWMAGQLYALEPARQAIAAVHQG